jgi:IS5 family transposase
MVYFCTESPFHYTTMENWRKRIGADKIKILLQETIRIAKEKKYLTEKDLSRVIIDTTVQEKNITFPTDSKLLSRAIIKLGKFCQFAKIKVRQSYVRNAKRAARKAAGYAHAKQFNRLNRTVHDLKNWLGRVLRDIERNKGDKPLASNFLQLIDTANKLLLQEKNSKNKIYSLHELNVGCISKGKEKNRYEFGNKGAVVITNKGTWILNTENLPNNPYDGHTLQKSVSGAEALTKVSITEIDVDRGYRGHDYQGSAEVRLSGSSNKGLSVSVRKRKRRRSAVEPVIGHLKSDHRLGRCFLHGLTGDALNLVGSAIGFNFRKLLRLLGRGIFSPARIWGCFLPKVGRMFQNFIRSFQKNPPSARLFCLAHRL